MFISINHINNVKNLPFEEVEIGEIFALAREVPEDEYGQLETSEESYYMKITFEATNRVAAVHLFSGVVRSDIEPKDTCITFDDADIN